MTHTAVTGEQFEPIVGKVKTGLASFSPMTFTVSQARPPPTANRTSAFGHFHAGSTVQYFHKLNYPRTRDWRQPLFPVSKLLLFCFLPLKVQSSLQSALLLSHIL